MIKVGTKVRVKTEGKLNIEEKIFVVQSLTQDREGNVMVDFMVNYKNKDDYSDLTWYPEELIILE